MSRLRKNLDSSKVDKVDALHLLDRCLTAHEGISAADHDNLIVEVAHALGVREGNTRLPSESEAAEMNISGCSVCGGDKGTQVHCTKCTRSYHMECVRPRPSRPGKEPKASYVCNYCIVEKKTGDVKEAAQRSLRLQRRLTAGLSVGDEKNLEKVEKKDETVVTKTGKRYAVRKTAKGQIVEVARCDTIEQALHALMTEGTSSAVARRKFDSEAQEGSLCTACFDDEAVQTCVFCGCRKCFGKHDSANILVCDGCDEEWHLYCLTPPLLSVPTTSQWHCSKCKTKKEKGTRPRGRPPLHAKKKEEESAKQAALATAVDPNAPPKPRGRGRPKGSKKQKDGSIVSPAASGAVSIASSASVAATSAAVSGAKVSSSNSLHSMDLADASSAAGIDAAATAAATASAVAAAPTKPPQDAVGIEAALAVISRAGFGRGLLPRDLEMFSQLRTWGPYSDISMARDAALQHRDVLKRKLSHLDSTSAQ
jgi:hypothetical protein